MAGPFQGAPLSLVAITPALAGPYDYGTVVVRVALHIDPLRRPRDRRLRNRAGDHRRDPDPAARNRGQHQPPNFMINPTNCSAFSVGSEGIGDQGTRGRLQLLLPGGQLLDARLHPEDDDHPTRRPQVHGPGQGPEPAVRPKHHPRRRQPQIGDGHPAEGLRDRPGTPRQPLRQRPSWKKNSAQGTARSAR